MNEWELSEKEMDEAERRGDKQAIGKGNPLSDIYKQVAHEAQKKLVEWINKQGLAPLGVYNLKPWRELCKELGIKK